MGETGQSLGTVVWITTELRTGGAERCLARLASESQQWTRRTLVISLMPVPTARTEVLARLQAAGIEVRSLQLESWLSLPRALKRLRCWLRELQPQVILSFLFHANVLTARARHAAPRARWIANARVADPRTWRIKIEGQALRGAEVVACVSDTVAEHVRSKLHVAAANTVVIPNGVDVPWLAAASDGSGERLPQGDRHVAVVGRLERQKGLDLLLSAWARRNDLSDWKLAIVGEGSERAALERLAVQCGIADRVTWCGWQSQPWEYLREVPLVLVPSRWEGMANVMLEAMAAGKVVLATEVEGTRSVLAPQAGPQDWPRMASGQPWQVVPRGAVDEMLDRMVQVLGNSELAARCGEWNRLRIADAFSWQQVLRRYEFLMKRGVPDSNDLDFV